MFDLLLFAVPLWGFTDNERALGVAGLKAQDPQRSHHRVSAKRGAADSIYALSVEHGQNQLCDKKKPLGVQRYKLSVNVEIRFLTGGKNALLAHHSLGFYFLKQLFF